MTMTLMTTIPDPPKADTVVRPPAPFWWPTIHGWITIGFFGLAFFVMWAVVFKKDAVADNQLFAQLATAIVVGALVGTILTFFMGSSQQSQQNQQHASLVTQTLAEHRIAPQPVRVVNRSSDPVPTEDTTNTNTNTNTPPEES